MHINFSLNKNGDPHDIVSAIAGVLEKTEDMTVFLNPLEASYARLGSNKAPRYISWSSENRSPLIRIPAAFGAQRGAELRSPDPAANPYIAYALLIYSGLYGLEKHLELPPAADFNLYTASADVLTGYRRLPETLADAKAAARDSEFIRARLPEKIISAYIG